MTKHINLHKNYTPNRGNYQLKLPLNIDYMIPDNDSVHLLSQFVEEMDLTDLYSTYSRIRENQATPRQMLKIVLYSYMNHNYSSRAMELSCRRDVNFMYLLEGLPVPDHSTFARFRSIHLAQCAETIMAEMTNFLYEIGEILGDAIFIDGTKIEACANKYTFVWKKAVSKNLERLLYKLADFVAECEELYGLKLVYENRVKIKHVKKLTVNRIIKRKSKTGYVSEKTIYTCEDCSNCNQKSKCIKGHNCKTPLEERVKNLETSKLFNMLRKEDLERIVSKEGCGLRMNRSIQAEGSFAGIKQDMGFRRFLSKGKNNVLAESILLAMAHNINKLHNKIQSDRTGTHLFPLKKSA